MSAAPTLVDVGPDGSVRIGSIRYWSLGSQELAGQQVRKIGPLPGDDFIILEPMGSSGEKIRAYPFACASFADATGFRAASDELIAGRMIGFRIGYAAGRRSVVNTESASYADRIGMALKRLRRSGKAALAKLFGENVGHAGRSQSNFLVEAGGRRDMGEHQVLQGFDAVEQRECGQVHSPDCGDHSGYADAPERIAARIFMHRLSEASE